MPFRLAALALAGLVTWPALAWAIDAGAADAPPGASSCSGCHSMTKGASSAIPSMAGESASTIAGSMREFKSGGRPATVMGRIAKGFSDSEIDAIAEWIAGKRQ